MNGSRLSGSGQVSAAGKTDDASHADRALGIVLGALILRHLRQIVAIGMGCKGPEFKSRRSDQ
jgi:hypothetical protein